jgi:hypothetical protein
MRVQPYLFRIYDLFTNTVSVSFHYSLCGVNPLGALATSGSVDTCPERQVSMIHSVEWELAGDTEVLGEYLPQCNSVHHKSQKT